MLYIKIPDLLFKAPDGVEDTRALFGVEYISFGSDGTLRWGDLLLRDGTSVKFAAPKSGYHLIVSYDWRNLTQCRFLNLKSAYKVTSIDVSCLNSIRVLIIWWSGIKNVNVTQNETLELLICGNTYPETDV